MKTVIVSPVSVVRPHTLGKGVAAAALTLTVAACSTNPTATPSPSGAGSTPAATGSTAAASCPTAPVSVVVSVDQWGDIVSELGGSCATVKTVLASSSVDPHDYEPSPADAESFSGAKLVVVNGDGYDAWASKLAAGSGAGARVVSAADVTRTPDGANPHLWYLPSAVAAVADAVSAELSKLDPQAGDYFGRRRTEFASAIARYTGLIGKIKAAAGGKSYAATETVFDYQAQALGLVNKTPEGYQRASANGTDPSPADIDAFRAELGARRVDVLIYNTQTEGSIPQQIRSAAERAGVPVVNVTETVPPGQTSFEAWQYAQLVALGKALGVAV
ncbi:ABC transporter substrate-binding protein [Mycobacterium sp. 1554424.7]|nr:ABC transporter substrate-binding protein [Mycobacterium sp. 1554424.7]